MVAQPGSGLAVGTVWPASHATEGGVLLSSVLRRNAGAALGDAVELWPIERAVRSGQLRVLPAACCALQARSVAAGSRAPLALPAGGSLRAHLLSQLAGRYVAEGHEIIVPLLGEKRVFRVTALQPAPLGQPQPEPEPEPEPASGAVGTLFLLGADTKLEIDTTSASQAPPPPSEDKPDTPAPAPSPPAAPPPVVGGLEKQLASARELLQVALHAPDRMERVGLRPPSGVLLHGPPGTGKTLIARTLAAECADDGVNFVSIDGAEIVGKYVGESEARLREIFEEASRAASGKTLIFIDEIDALAPSRERGSGRSELHNRIVATLLTLLDGVKPSAEELGGTGNDEPGRIFVIAATNRPDALDEALRRPGRLDREVEVGVPTEAMRLQVLQAILGTVPNSLSAAALGSLAASSHGFTGADLSLLAKEATLRAVRRVLPSVATRPNPEAEEETGLQQARMLCAFYAQPLPGVGAGSKTEEQCAAILKKRAGPDRSELPHAEWAELCDKLTAKYPGATDPRECGGASASDAAGGVGALMVCEADMVAALGVVRPSCMREVQLEIPKVLWADIGGGASLQQELREAVEWPLAHPEAFVRMGIRPPRGILLYGPPGCSKTLTARALATESRLNFIAVKGPELFSKWVGESEKAVRDVYRKARAAAPAIVFFDEIDALAAQRGAAGSASVGDRVLSQLLTELDGVLSNTGSEGALATAVVTIAATNRPDLLDAALLRPGRFDRQVYVGAPDLAARAEILRIGLRDIPTADGLNLQALALRAEGFSGAEMAALCREASMAALSDGVAAVEAGQGGGDAAAVAQTLRVTAVRAAGHAVRPCRPTH